MALRVLTIGHSTHPIARFVALLKDAGVTTLADVRSQPMSRFNPQFNRAALQAAVEKEGVTYLFLGDRLGGRTSDPAALEGGRVSFEKYAATKPFGDGIAEVKKAAAKQTVALMCAEKDPLQCHRAILVARRLADDGVVVEHIHSDGALEPQAAFEQRLLQAAKVAPDLARSPAKARDDAYRALGAAMGWTPKPPKKA